MNVCFCVCLLVGLFSTVAFLSSVAVHHFLVCDWMTLLFHAAAEHLIGCDEHNTDDESNGEGADQTLPYTRLLHLLGRT